MKALLNTELHCSTDFGFCSNTNCGHPRWWQFGKPDEHSVKLWSFARIWFNNSNAGAK